MLDIIEDDWRTSNHSFDSWSRRRASAETPRGSDRRNVVPVRGPLRATKGLIFFWGVQKCWSGASGVERTWVWLGGFIGASRRVGTVRSGGVGDEACADTVISGWSVGS